HGEAQGAEHRLGPALRGRPPHHALQERREEASAHRLRVQPHPLAAALPGHERPGRGRRHRRRPEAARVSTPPPHVSAVIPVYNEEANLPELNERMIKALDSIGKSWELIYV